ncbi:MAG: hypothetical protein MJZ73_06145 [Bacteroidaceae bacterium]|nr:hypothetical protein [Bacteroidaceae bacterium]
MKKNVICLLALSLTLNGYAQKKRKPAPAKPTVDQQMEQAKTAITEYRFSEAVDLLEEVETTLTKKKLSTAEVEDLMDKAEFGLRMLRGTDQIQVVDTFVVDKANFLQAYKLSEETGKLDYFAKFFNIQGEGTVFQNELGNRVYFGKSVGEVRKIFSSDLLAGNQWGEAQELSGIGDDHTSEDYPFVTSDGSTLYFASKGADNGLGGYDIYVTRIGNASSRYLRPENLGMPYNSPYNDYMYVVDELHNLGWFASDRFQPEGKVCLYVFIPNESRNPFDLDEDEAELVRHGALLDQIKTTQTDAQALKIARNELQEAIAYKPKEKKVKDFELVIDDTRTYTTYAEFKNASAKKLCQEWVKKFNELQMLELKLEDNRLQYAEGNKQLAASIQQQETQFESLYNEVHELEKQTRNAEIGK